MDKTDFLKQQHLSMFEEKRAVHKQLVSTLYQQYISDKEIEKEDQWLLYSRFYQYFSESFPTEIYEEELIVGTNWHWCWQQNSKEIIIPKNGGHFIANFSDFLKKGINGKLDDARKMTHSTALETALKALSNYIKRYADAAIKKAEEAFSEKDKGRLLTIADDCKFISENPPVTFRQALQLIWFIQSFLNMESGSAAISLGRADSYLYPYYKQDIERNILTPEEAKKLIACFYIKISEGDESCMLTVGGDTENELTSLLIEVQTRITMRQPSIALRISEKTSADVLNKATELVLNGCGMPAYFNDAVIIKGLKMLGFDDESAADYGIVGCYEPSPQGIFSNTVASCFHLYDSFNSFLAKEDTYSSFDVFLKAYNDYFEHYYKNTLLPELKSTAQQHKNRISPFASCVLNCEKLLFGINVFGIGILIDSIYTIKKLVFDTNTATIKELKTQAEQDFTDIRLYKKILELNHHYGSDSQESNQLARDISRLIGSIIRRNPIDDTVISAPALFWFTGDIWQRNYSGTINGRKRGELLSYGIMPCATPHKDSLTSMLMSCANISAEYFPDGCPVMISLNQKDIKQENVLSSLIKTFFKAGGFHLAVNTTDAKLLKEAKEHPSEHSDILVKISGYSTQFTTLNEKIQDAVIERAVIK